MSLLRKLLLTVMVMGSITSTVRAGTFASFNASTTNGSSTFATGTLVLSDQKGTATPCFSTGTTAPGGQIQNGNANTACDQLFALSVQKPGDSASVDLTLQDVGSIDATLLSLNASETCTPGDAPGQTYHGVGDPCGSIQVYVQEYATQSLRTANDRTGGTCWYGGGTATSCAFSATKTLDTFDSSYPPGGTGMSMGALAGTTTRWLRIYLSLPTTANNNLQGKQATFGFTWTIV